ncbi:uncharacterized protein RCH25_007107 isoform 2-T2 [Pelodytes ibericus]
MNWDAQLDSILTATDGNMAKIKERLYSRGELTRGDGLFDLPQIKTPGFEDKPAKPLSPYVSYSNGWNPPSSSEDMVTLSDQLLSQAKMISSLHQAITRLERDRDQQQHRIQSLEDEVRRLRGARGDALESELERRMERLRQEMSGELKLLQERGRVSPSRDSAVQRSSIVQDVSENKRLLWKEYESLRRDTDYLHQRLRRQEDDMLRQLTDSQEAKCAQDRNAKMLGGLLDSQQRHTMEINRTRSDTQGLQRDLLQIRSTVGELKEDMRILEGKVFTHSARYDRTEKNKPSVRKKKQVSSSSSSGDDSSRVSLADISSEDTSCTLDCSTKSTGSRVKSSSSRNSDTRDKTTSGLNLDEFSDDLDGLSDSPPELNFSDL